MPLASSVIILSQYCVEGIDLRPILMPVACSKASPGTTQRLDRPTPWPSHSYWKKVNVPPAPAAGLAAAAGAVVGAAAGLVGSAGLAAAGAVVGAAAGAVVGAAAAGLVGSAAAFGAAVGEAAPAQACSAPPPTSRPSVARNERRSNGRAMWLPPC